MVKLLKRIPALVILAAAGIWLVIHGLRLFEYPHLYLDLGRITLTNVLFLGGALLCLALAVVAGIYLIFNADGKLADILISGILCMGLFVGCYFLVERGVEGIPCTYTASPTDYQEEFRAEDFRVNGADLYPGEDRSILNAFAYYENGGVRWQRVIRIFDKNWTYQSELRRLNALKLDAFTEDNWTCFQIVRGDTVWQIQADDRTRQVTYSRYDRPDEKPGVAPDLLAPSPDENENLRPTSKSRGT